MKSGFWKKVLIIGLPVAIQNLINTLVNMCDTLMISELGEDFVSAVGLANKVFFVFNLLVFGIVSGASVLTSQFYGNGDSKGLSKTFGFSLILSLSASFSFFLAAFIAPKFLLNLFTESSGLIEIGASYLKIVCISYVFTAVSMTITSLLKSVNRTRAPMFITLGCVGVNIFFNYMFIFGKFGASAMAAEGAAIGTLIARAVEMIALIGYLVFSKKDYVIKIGSMFSFSKAFIKKIMKLSTPVICNEFAWGLGTTIYSVIYGHMGNDVVAAMTIAAILQDLAFAFLLGISNAAAIIVGNQLGASMFEDAKKTASRLLKANFIIAIILGVVVIFIARPFLLIYGDLSTEVKNHIFNVTIIYGIALPFKSFNLTNVCGVLRSGGDTLFCMLLDIGGVWCIAIPLGAISAFVFKFNLPIVFAFIISEEIVKLIIGIPRYKKEKWVKNVTHLQEI